MKKKIMALCASVVMAFTLLAPMTVLAWEDDEVISGGSQDVKQVTTGDVEVEGTIGKMTDIDPGDPDAPIPEGDDMWIKVSIPTKVLFGSTFEANNTDKKIIAPKYNIVNYSGRAVTVSVKSFTKTNADANNALLNGTQLNLVSTITNKGELLNGGTAELLNPSTNATLATPIEIFRLKAGICSTGSKIVDQDMGAAQIKITGSLDSNYDYSQLMAPSYKLVLQFKAIDKADY